MEFADSDDDECYLDGLSDDDITFTDVDEEDEGGARKAVKFTKITPREDGKEIMGSNYGKRSCR